MPTRDGYRRATRNHYRYTVTGPQSHDNNPTGNTIYVRGELTSNSNVLTWGTFLVAGEVRVSSPNRVTLLVSTLEYEIVKITLLRSLHLQNESVTERDMERDTNSYSSITGPSEDDSNALAEQECG